MIRTGIAAPALALALVLVTAGCSGDPPPGSTTPTTPTAPATSDRPTGVIPEVQVYVDAVSRKDLDALVNSFAENGRIIDVQRTITGRAAIRTWADGEVIGGTLRVLSAGRRRADGQRLLVHWEPAGSSGWRAHYDFTVAGGKIVSADLQYA